jgi:hypothetical protein
MFNPGTLISLFLVLSLIGCASRNSGWDENLSKINLSKEDRSELQLKAQAAWEKRHIKQELLDALDAYESLANASVGREFYNYAVLLTRGYYFLADAHEENVESKKKYWNISIIMRFY